MTAETIHLPARPVDTIALNPSDRGCATCGEVYGTLGSFDAHQVIDYKQRPPVTCLRPEDLGLVRDARGVWRSPEAVAKLAVNTDRLRAVQRRRWASQ
jgi:hypothetical protein